jgi:transcriptional regulator with XRE-family HTH domain
MAKRYTDLKADLLKNPAVRKEYEALQPNYEAAKLIASMRNAANLTQAELAEKIGTRQANISRAEKGQHSVTISTIFKVADATGHNLKIKMERKKNPKTGGNQESFA